MPSYRVTGYDTTADYIPVRLEGVLDPAGFYLGPDYFQESGWSNTSSDNQWAYYGTNGSSWIATAGAERTTQGSFIIQHDSTSSKVIHQVRIQVGTPDGQHLEWITLFSVPTDVSDQWLNRFTADYNCPPATDGQVRVLHRIEVWYSRTGPFVWRVDDQKYFVNFEVDPLDGTYDSFLHGVRMGFQAAGPFDVVAMVPLGVAKGKPDFEVRVSLYNSVRDSHPRNHAITRDRFGLPDLGPIVNAIDRVTLYEPGALPPKPPARISTAPAATHVRFV